MASQNSRIPFPPSSSRKRQNENAPVECGNDGLMGKKRKLNVPPQKPIFQKSISAGSIGTAGRFSEAPKRGTLRSQVNRGNVRESMPAVNAVQKMGPPVVSKPKKIPAWDLKGRMEQMEKINGVLRDELQTYNGRIAALEEDKSKLNVDVEIKSQQSERATAAMTDLETKLREKTDALTEQIKTKEQLQAQYDSSCKEVGILKSEVAALQAELSSHKTLVVQLTASHSSAQSHLDATKLLLSEITEDRDRLRNQNEDLQKKLKDYEAKVQEDETFRRQLHNTIQELKGNIRVFCRVRPPLAEEVENNLHMSSIHMKNDSKTLEICRTHESSSESHAKGRNNHEFTFDSIFKDTASQDDVFLEISQLVQSVLDGFNVCIFAYGQTGSGKTYTMEGPASISSFMYSEDPNLGMIPRSVKQIFSSAKLLEEKGWKYVMEASFLEIYNENIRDLLAGNHQNSSLKCQIKRTAEKGGDGYISNVNNVQVSSEREVYVLMQKARINRAVAATNSNEHSSRSHYIFQMKLKGDNEMTGESCEGILNLVDLAGSERIKDSGSAGERLTEAKNINKSLSNLGNVILALSQKAEHIPYRNSKLTHLLMNSLGGNSKALMFVNINPCEDSFNETVNSLRFATKVNQCNIGTAQKRLK